VSFIWPPLLASLLLIPAGLLVHRRIDRDRRRRAAALGAVGGVGSAAAGPASPGRTLRLRDRIPAALVLVALAVLAVALARPQAAVPIPRAEGTVILTFDVSASMAATDVEPSRMELAKAVARATVDQLPDGVVIGVVAFSDAGLSVQVPTGDRAAVTAAIDRLAPALGGHLARGRHDRRARCDRRCGGGHPGGVLQQPVA
jgi:Ca-activated chloride channel family protein